MEELAGVAVVIGEVGAGGEGVKGKGVLSDIGDQTV